MHSMSACALMRTSCTAPTCCCVSGSGLVGVAAPNALNDPDETWVVTHFWCCGGSATTVVSKHISTTFTNVHLYTKAYTNTITNNNTH